MADQAINYKDAVNYWSSVSADEDGVLGGFGLQTAVPKVDASGSIAFVERLGQLSPSTFPNAPRDMPADQKIALDVGAGIGRVSRDVISKFCPEVDILEPALPLIEKAKEIESVVKVRNYFPVGLQELVFPEYHYWVVWCQWCLGQAPDEVVVRFLEKCSEHLQKGGIIIVKENNATGANDIFDPTDSSVTRTHEKFKQLFAKAGLRVLLSSLQRGLPKDLYPVRLYALSK